MVTKRKKPAAPAEPREPRISPEGVAVMAARLALTEFVSSDARREDLKGIVREAVNEAFGVQAATPEEREALRKDMIHLRTWRELMDSIRDKGVSAVVWWVFAAGAAGLAIIFGAKFGFKVPSVG